MAKKKIKITKEFKQAFQKLENSSDHIFLTGKAGTGKSTLLRYFRKKTEKKYVVLAPTGVAALNVKGQTIHSFFGFHPSITPALVRKSPPDTLKTYRSVETIIIDEISMVRADLMDCIDKALRINRGIRKPFGGVQMIFIGDLFQLPPVVTREDGDRFQTEYASPYFFSSSVLRGEHISVIELKKVHRQSDTDFVQLLEGVRKGSVSEDDIDLWNERHNPYFDPENEAPCIHLTTTNKMAKQRNDNELERLPGKNWSLKARSMGDLPDRRMPSEARIDIKAGARVMFTLNDPERRWVNGSLGTVKKIKKNGLSKYPVIVVQLDSGKEVEVAQHTWELFEYRADADGDLDESVVGSYTQYPLTLAWAVTIHKAQGKTFDRALIDVGWGAFAHGQMYVALSRCTDFEGITLLKPLKSKDIILDNAVVEFMEASS